MRLTSLANFASFTVQQGALRVDDVTSNNVGSLGDGNLTLNTGRLAYGGTDATLSKPFTVDASGGGLDVLNAGTTLTLTSPVTSNGVLNKTGPGVRSFTVAAGQTLAGSGVSNTSSGRIIVNGTANVSDFVSNGVVTINPGGAINNAGTPFVMSGGSRTLVGSAASPGGAINLGGPTLEINGALLVNNGAISGATNVNYGSLATGAGSFGTVNIFDGGAFSPGNSPGAATLAAASFNAGGSYLFELGDAAGTPGSGIDFLDISGALRRADNRPL